MYKYFSELEKKEDFKIYLVKNNWNMNQNRKVLKKITLDFIKNNQQLFAKLEWLEQFILAHDEKFGYPLFMDGEKRWNLSEFFYYLEELPQHREECGLNEIKFITDSDALIRKLEEYEVSCNYFCSIYPERQEVFLKIKKDIEKVYHEMYRVIQIPPSNKIVEYTVPDGWYLTKSGFLYNPNGEVGDNEKGHKAGNLKYSFDRIKETLISNNNIEELYYTTKESYKEHLEKIMKDGYVSELDFWIYSNLTNNFNIILTEQMLREKEIYNRVINLPDTELKPLYTKNQTIMIERKFPEREKLIELTKTPQKNVVSYQSNINTLVKGYFAAVIDVYDAFKKLNVSNKKEEIYQKIWQLSKQSYNDVLIRFCGFSKIERGEKKITTASLDGIKLFKKYLELGWDLYIIPEIIYSEAIDDIMLDPYFTRKHLEHELTRYQIEREREEDQGKGRVLISGINC